MNTIAGDELAAMVLEPHFDAVRDTFADFVPVGGEPLARLGRVKFIVDADVHNTKRHYAACRDDAAVIYLASEAVDLPLDVLVAMLCHEFGHAADFAYPGQWLTRKDEPAEWVESGSGAYGAWSKGWPSRNRDQVEWAADSIAQAVTGHKIGYCGDCMLQCFEGGKSRPKGLR